MREGHGPAALRDRETIFFLASEGRGRAEQAKRPFEAARVRARVALARTDPRIRVPSDTLDTRPWLLNVENGTLDLHTGALHPHRRADCVTQLAPVRYDPEAVCPSFQAFLD